MGQPVRQASALVREGATCHLVTKEESLVVKVQDFPQSEEFHATLHNSVVPQKWQCSIWLNLCQITEEHGLP